MSRTRRNKPNWVKNQELRGEMPTPFYKIQEKRNFKKTGFVRTVATALSRSERRAANALAKKGIEKVDNPRILARAEWYD